jgi:predicted secreted protein
MKTNITISLCIAIVLMLSSCAIRTPFKKNAVMPAVTMSRGINEKKLINLPLGQILAIRLDGNATTGYMWRLLANNNLSILEEQEDSPDYIPNCVEPNYNDDGGVAGFAKEVPEHPFTKCGLGSGGITIFKFKAVKIGKQTINFVYDRSIPIKEFVTSGASFNIIVK